MVYAIYTNASAINMLVNTLKKLDQYLHVCGHLVKMIFLAPPTTPKGKQIPAIKIVLSIQTKDVN